MSRKRGVQGVQDANAIVGASPPPPRSNVGPALGGEAGPPGDGPTFLGHVSGRRLYEEASIRAVSTPGTIDTVRDFENAARGGGE